MILNFPTYLERNMYTGLEALKNWKMANLKWFSLLMYLILFHGRNYFEQFTDLEFERDGEPLPVQLWTIVLSSNWEKPILYYLRMNLPLC